MTNLAMSMGVALKKALNKVDKNKIITVRVTYYR